MKNGLKNGTENLHIIGDIIEQVRVGMLTTIGKNGVFSSRPMWVQEVDSYGQVWFFTSKASFLIDQVRGNSKVQLTFADSAKNKFLTANAVATEVSDKERMKELWDPTLRAWFKEGLETPDIVLLKVSLEEAEFWDSPNSAVVRIVGLVKGIMSDQVYEPGQHERVTFPH